MKKCIIFMLISCAFILSACSSSSVSQNQNFPETDVSISTDTPQLDELNPQTDAEKQLAIFAESYGDWSVEEECDWWGYAVTDLDQDGNWEIIASECHGTGHYTTTSIYEIDSYHVAFERVVSDTSPDEELTLKALSHGRPLQTGLLLKPNQEMSDVPQTYPAYYDEDQNVYYYIYEDSGDIESPDFRYGTFMTQASFSLSCGEIPEISLGGEPEGILLGCKRIAYHGDYTNVDCWDMYGNYISEDTYSELSEQYYGDLQKKELNILWIECQHLDDLSKSDIYDLLKFSMASFALSDK